MLSLRSDSFASCTLAPEPERFVASRESLLNRQLSRAGGGALVDFDEDGDLDLVVTAGDDAADQAGIGALTVRGRVVEKKKLQKLVRQYEELSKQLDAVGKELAKLGVKVHPRHLRATTIRRANVVVDAVPVVRATRPAITVETSRGNRTSALNIQRSTAFDDGKPRSDDFEKRLRRLEKLVETLVERGSERQRVP